MSSTHCGLFQPTTVRLQHCTFPKGAALMSFSKREREPPGTRSTLGFPCIQGAW